MESEESTRHSAHRFLQGERERVSPTDGKEERPKYNHGIVLLGRAFLTFPSVPFQNYKNGSDNILLGSCEILKLEMQALNKWEPLLLSSMSPSRWH